MEHERDKETQGGMLRNEQKITCYSYIQPHYLLYIYRVRQKRRQQRIIRQAEGKHLRPLIVSFHHNTGETGAFYNIIVKGTYYYMTKDDMIFYGLKKAKTKQILE